MAIAHDHFIPAAGRRWLLPLYDPFVALFSRERHWRGEILKSLDLKPDDVLVDVGCGTGTLAIMAKENVPQAEIIGVDPDPDALARAGKKAARKNAAIAFERGFGDETAKVVGAGRATKAVSSLAFHHMPQEMQTLTIASIYEALAPGGALHLADFVGGHVASLAEDTLIGGLSAAEFKDARVISRFRVAFANVALIRAEKARR